MMQPYLVCMRNLRQRMMSLLGSMLRRMTLLQTSSERPRCVQSQVLRSTQKFSATQMQ